MAAASATAVDEEGYDPAWLELEAAMGGRKHLTGTIEEKRAQFDAFSDGLQALWPKPLVDGRGNTVEVDVEDTTIPAPPDSYPSSSFLSPNNNDNNDNNNNNLIPLRIYKPRSTTTTTTTTTVVPTIVWYHGGGRMSGTLSSEDAQCRLVAASVPATVVSVGYGTLPERSVAGMLGDCLAGFEWAWERAAPAGNEGEKRVVVLGGSAGGALACGVVRELALRGRRRGARCAGGVGVFPVTVHWDRPPERWEGLYGGSMRELWETAPVVRGLDQKGVMVKFAYDEEALKKFPRTYIATAGKDPMRDDGVVLEAALKDAGVPVRRMHYERMPHYFWFFPQLGEKTMRFVEDLVEGVWWVLAEDES